MAGEEPKYRRPLNQEQVIILTLIYKFRFVTVAKVKDYFTETNPGMNVFKRLEVLIEQGFIAKRYLDNFRLLHKPVVYYLLPTGVRKLNEYRDESDNADIKSIYRDGALSEQFIMHCITIFGLYNRLTTLYGDELDFLSKSDQVSHTDLEQKPDAYITLETSEGIRRHYFANILDDDAHLLVDASKKIKRYIEHRKNGNWATMKTPFPTIIFVCNSEDACQRVQKRLSYLLNKAWVTEASFILTTYNNIKLF